MTDIDDVTAWERETARSWETTKPRRRTSKVYSNSTPSGPEDFMADAMELIAKWECFERRHPGLLADASRRLTSLRSRS